MFKILPLFLLLVVFLPSSLGFTDTIDGNVAICETTPSSPLTSELMDFAYLGIDGGISCRQDYNGANGHPGRSFCGKAVHGSLKISICRAKGSSFGLGQVKAALRNLARDYTRTYVLHTAAKTGGKWRDKGGEFMILEHI